MHRTVFSAALAAAAACLIGPAAIAAGDDLMEKLRQKTLELQQRRTKPSPAPAKPAPKPAETRAPGKAPPSATSPARTVPPPDGELLATAKYDKTGLRATWDGACAERAGVVVRVAKGAPGSVAPGIEKLLTDAQAKLSARCARVTSIDAVVLPAGQPRATVQYALAAADGWQPARVDMTQPTEGAIAFTSSRGDGWLAVSATGAVTGTYVTRSTLPGTVEGAATPGYDPVVKDRIDRWIVDGHWFEHGSAKEKCDRPRQGFAYWGSVRWEIPATDTLAGMPGLVRPCGEFADRGRTSEWHLAAAAGVEAPNPFAGLPVPPAAELPGDALRSGTGWWVRPGAQRWCEAGAAQLDVSYEAPHEARDVALSGRDAGTYDDFVREQILPFVLDACPSAAAITLRNLRTGESVARDVVAYDIVPGQRDSDVTPPGPPSLRRR